MHVCRAAAPAVRPGPTLTTIQRLARETANIVAAYRREIEAAGASSAEASDLAHRFEDRLLRPILDQPPVTLQSVSWADVEAFFLAVVRLQLAMGHPPDAAAAVDYIIRAGIDLPDISPAEARHLARRVPIPPTAIYGAFQFARLIEKSRLD